MITLSLLADLEMKSEYDNTDVGRVPVAEPGTQKHQVTSKPLQTTLVRSNMQFHMPCTGEFSFAVWRNYKVTASNSH